MDEGLDDQHVPGEELWRHWETKEPEAAPAWEQEEEIMIKTAGAADSGLPAWGFLSH